MCDPTYCPRTCDVDAGDQFAYLEDNRHWFDCRRTEKARAVYDAISGGDHSRCHDLVTACLPSSHLLSPQPSACIVACRDPKHNGNAICPDWDDTQSMCFWYADFHCVATHAHCDATRLEPPPTRCERKCLAHPPPSAARRSGAAVEEEEEGGAARPTDRLDRFLRCVTTCREGDDDGDDRHAAATTTGEEAPAAISSPAAGVDHCECAHPTHLPLCSCVFANGTVWDKFEWGSRAECEAACHS